MKTKHIFTALLLAGSLFVSAQNKQIREITSYNKIDASGAPTITYRQSDSLTLVVEAEPGDLENIETRVSDNTLFIKTNGNVKHPYKIRLSGNTLNSISASGATNFKTLNTLKADSLVIEASGASNMNLFVNARTVKSIVSGASDVTMEGNNDNLYADVSGASNFKSYKLASSKTNVTSSGASTAKVFASDRLTANATGASTIKFKGEPKEVSAEGSISSQIIRIAADDSQTKAIGKDSSITSFNWGHKKIIISDDDHKMDSLHKVRKINREFRHWDGFFMGVTGFTDPHQSFYINKPYNYMELDYSRSFNWQLNLWQQNVHIIKNYLNLCTGIGFDFNRYQFANKVKLNPDSSFTWGNVDSTGTFSYKKNRLTSYYLSVPLLLDLNTSTNPHKSFHISVGVVGKYLLGARTKQIVQKNGDTFTQIRNDGYNLNPFQFNAYASVGYGNITLFAQYGLNEMFQHNKGPELYPFSVGVRLANFN
jgi:hypothetical protein